MPFWIHLSWYFTFFYVYDIFFIFEVVFIFVFEIILIFGVVFTFESMCVFTFRNNIWKRCDPIFTPQIFLGHPNFVRAQNQTQIKSRMWNSQLSLFSCFDFDFVKLIPCVFIETISEWFLSYTLTTICPVYHKNGR